MSALRSLARLVARGARAPRSPHLPGRASLEHAGLVADPARVSRYLAATGGEPVAALRGPDALLPPLFHATWVTPAALDLLSRLEPPLPLGAVVHLEEETTWVRAARADAVFRCRVALERAETVRKGLRMSVAAQLSTAAGVLCARSTLVFLLRTRTPPGPPAARRDDRGRAEGDADGGGPWDEVVRWSMGPGDGRRYARASGDYNPIHLWPATSRPFGFPRPILHGYCTEARVAHALLAHRLGGAPEALRRLSIAFRAPLALPAAARLLVAAADDGAEHRFRVASEDGETVYAEGRFTGGGVG